MQGIVAEGQVMRRARTGAVPAGVRAVAACASVLWLSGCYLVQAASGEIDLLARSRPIPRVIADPSTDRATRDRLRLVEEARAFAVQDLGLGRGDSFRRYAELDRPYALWNVVATPEFSLRPLRWCFPVAGCVAYRGYFSQSSAQALAFKLTAGGDDATVDGVGTFSTLGHFPDPVLSTMLHWQETRLVGTIFHELAHERLYVSGDSEFNEAFASVVEDAGVRRWLAARGEARLLATFEASRRREAEFVALLREARARLDRIYRDGAPPAEMRVEKFREFGRLKFAYSQLRATWGGYAGYDRWFARPLNNANLVSVATYEDCVPGLEEELAAAGSLTAFYARAEGLAALSWADRHAAVCHPRAGDLALSQPRAKLARR
jgi:predicted aminopeptidase